jgi:hypothetical protein
MATAITIKPNIELFFIMDPDPVSGYKNTKRKANKVYYKTLILFRIILDWELKAQS